MWQASQNHICVIIQPLLCLYSKCQNNHKRTWCYRQQVSRDTLTWCYRRTLWGWLMTLACSGWLIQPAMIYVGLVLGMQARPASTGTESSSSSTRTSLQPMTSCQTTSRWRPAHAHLPHNAAAAVAILSSPGAMCGHTLTARHGWSCYVLRVVRLPVSSKLHDWFWGVARDKKLSMRHSGHCLCSAAQTPSYQALSLQWAMQVSHAGD